MDGLKMFHLIAGVPVDLCQDSIFCSARRGFGRRLPWFDLLIENMGHANTWDMEVRMQGEHLKHHPSFIHLPYLFFASFSLLSVRLGEIGVTWVGLPLAGWGSCDKTQQHLHTNLRFSGQLVGRWWGSRGEIPEALCFLISLLATYGCFPKKVVPPNHAF